MAGSAGAWVGILDAVEDRHTDGLDHPGRDDSGVIALTVTPKLPPVNMPATRLLPIAALVPRALPSHGQRAHGACLPIASDVVVPSGDGLIAVAGQSFKATLLTKSYVLRAVQRRSYGVDVMPPSVVFPDVRRLHERVNWKLTQPYVHEGRDRR